MFTINCGCKLTLFRNDSLTMYLFLLKGVNIGTKSLSRLQEEDCKADEIALNGAQLSLLLCILCEAHTQVAGLVPTGFIDLLVSFCKLLESTSS